MLARGDKVAAIGGVTATARPGVDLRRWTNKRGTTPNIVPAAIRAEADLIRAEAAAGAALQLKRDGFHPDVIIGHPGWGETLHLKLVWPEARLILFGEYFYRPFGGDSDFDPEFGMPDFAERMRINGKAAAQSMAYVLADRIICPTPHQAATFPDVLQSRISVIHEGVDLSRARREPDAQLVLPGNVRLDASTPVITFINRTMEPLRGFHIFMRALPAFLDAVPDGRALIIGEDRPSGYGKASPDGKGWKAAMLAELGDRLDLSRVHFLGRVQHDAMIGALSIGAAHVYYTYPFVLSWSLVEAMACECLVLASDTAPVRDAITDGVDGRLLPFFDVDALSQAMIDAAREPVRFEGLRKAARKKALEGFDRAAGTAGWLRAIDTV
nr:glycosyltransferase [Sphingomonas quercus]